MAQPEAPRHIEGQADNPGILVATFTNPTDFTPAWQLYQILECRGFSLRAELREHPTEVLEYAKAHPEQGSLVQTIDLFSDKLVQAADLRLRASIVRELPDFDFLVWADNIDSTSLGLVEDVVYGRVMDEEVQNAIPGAQYITINDEDKRAVLAGSYARSQEVSEHLQALMPEQPLPLSPEEEDIREFEKMDAAFIPTDFESELAELRRKRAELDAKPISVERFREIISSLVDRVEDLLVPNH